MARLPGIPECRSPSSEEMHLRNLWGSYEANPFPAANLLGTQSSDVNCELWSHYLSCYSGKVGRSQGYLLLMKVSTIKPSCYLVEPLFAAFVY